MADVQLEDGFTRLANELMEALARVDIPGRHMRVMLCVIRNTYGRRAPGGGSKKADRIGSVNIARGSGIDPADVRRCLRDLTRWGMVTRHGGGSGRGDSPMVGVQKDYDQWSVAASEAATRQADYRRKRGDKAGARYPAYKAGRQSGVTTESGVTNGQKRGDVTPESGVTSPRTKDVDSSKITPHVSGEKERRKPTQADFVRRTREVWPKLRDIANDTYGRSWGTHPSKRATELLVPLLRRGVPEADLVVAIHGCAALNRVREEPERLMYVRAQTVYQPTKFDGYVELGREAQEKRSRGSPRARREAQRLAEWLAEHDRLRAEIERERKGGGSGG